MPLISCKDCYKEISNAAHSCPSCGCPTGKGKYTSIAAVFSLIFVIVNLYMISSVLGLSDPNVITLVYIYAKWTALVVASGLPVIMIKLSR